MISRTFPSVIYNSFRRLSRDIRERAKGSQSLAKFYTKSSEDEVNQIHMFEKKTGISTKDNPLRNVIEPLRRSIIQPLWSAIQPLRRAIQPLRRNDEPRQFTKPVVIHKQRNYSIKHLKRVYNSYITFNSVLWLHEYRSSVRKLTKQPNVKRYRDREPSRIPFKRIILAMRKRKNRRSIKHVLKRSAPKSSILNKIATNYKMLF